MATNDVVLVAHGHHGPRREPGSISRLAEGSAGVRETFGRAGEVEVEVEAVFFAVVLTAPHP
jgi:hypothetical protein